MRLVCLNVHGLTGQKLLHLLSWLQETHADGAILTETQTPSDPEDLLRHQPGAGAIWPGARFFHCPGSGHTLGITVVFGPSVLVTDVAPFVDLDSGGRILRLDLQLCSQPICLVAVYGPTATAERGAFFEETLPQHLPADGRPLLLTGDFNCVVDVLDCVQPPAAPPPATNTRLIGGTQLRVLMASYQLHDVWRDAHPNLREHTHWSQLANSGGRLDRWLASSSFLHTFQASCSILPSTSIATDHLPVLLSTRLASYHGPRRGKGLQAFPLLLLNMGGAVAELASMVSDTASSILLADEGDVLVLWDQAKERLRTASLHIFRKHQRIRQLAARQADAAAQLARRRLAQASPVQDFSALLLDVQRTAAAATEAWQVLAGRAEHSSNILEHLFGDQSSFFFHQKARSPHPPVVIKQLNRPGRQPDDPPGTADLSTTAGVTLALDYATRFYSSSSACGLFRPRSDVDAASQDSLLASLEHRLSPDTAALAEGLDGDSLLSTEELELALQMVKRGAAPGVDGLPYEFYRAFRQVLLPVLVRVFNAAFKDTSRASPLAPFLLGILCLIPKPGQGLCELTFFRPITLLNCDAKLVMSVMANRLQRPLDYVIDITQSAFLRGRDISDNVRYHLGLSARLRELGLPGWLLHSDLTMAYDTVDRGWLTRAMTALGFKDTGIVRWCRILMAGSCSQVRVNGFFTAPFSNSSGIPQGSSKSCSDWAIVLQPFMANLNSLRSQGRITGFALPHGQPAPASLAFADDTKIVVVHPEVDGPEIASAFRTGFAAGLPSQSIPKTKLVHLHGNIPPAMDPALHTHHEATGYKLHPLGQPHRLLGVPLSNDPDQCAEEAFGHLEGSMLAAAAAWAPLKLNVFGRAHVAMQCLASKCLFQANFRAPPPGTLDGLQRVINRFVATSSRPEEEVPFNGSLFPRFAISVLPVNKGGIGLPNLAAHTTAMLAKTSWLLFRHTSHPWQTLFRHEVAAASPAVPGHPRGYHSLITAPPGFQMGEAATPLVRESASAFAQLHLQRVVPPDQQDFNSVLLELTFNNPLPDSPPILLSTVSSAAAQS